MERVTAERDWVTIADADEFHAYQEAGWRTIGELTRAAEQEGAEFVMGTLVDRVAADGRLSKIQPDRDLHAQFPLGCRVIQRLTKGSTNKVVAFTARWRSNTGNHLLVSAQRAKEYFGAAPGGVRNVRGGSAGAEDLYGLTPYARHPEWFEDYSTEAGPTRVPARLSITVPVHHFKWHAGVLASAARRLEYYGSVAEQSALPRYAQYSESASILERLQDQRIPIEAL
ncbi:hypothetical protein H632_c55p2 [Helicosporidium sp. ATCC 50920]|nr:hypothetical protein H632_c55p2 [Helicosporidium sp. ATCC 50920]|eukprot:KDD76961.1 hypothetical protein H632_c55p2 [Helicosporidium sp. ATCC 50920]